MSEHTEDRPRTQTFENSDGGGDDEGAPAQKPADAPFVLTKPMDLVRVRGFGSGSSAGFYPGRGDGSGGRGGRGGYNNDFGGGGGGRGGYGQYGQRDGFQGGRGRGGGRFDSGGDSFGRGRGGGGRFGMDGRGGGRGGRFDGGGRGGGRFDTGGRFDGGGRGGGFDGGGRGGRFDGGDRGGAVMGGRGESSIGGRGRSAGMEEIEDGGLDYAAPAAEKRTSFKEDKKKIKGYDAKNAPDKASQSVLRGRKDRLQADSLDEELYDDDSTDLSTDDNLFGAAASAAAAMLGEAAEKAVEPSPKPKAAVPVERTQRTGGRQAQAQALKAAGRPIPTRGRGRGRGRARRRKGRSPQPQAPPPAPAVVRLPGPTVVVSDLAEMMEVRPAEVLKHLMLDLGIMATVTQSIDSDTARQVANNFEVEVDDGASGEYDDEVEVTSVGEKGTAIEIDAEDTLVPRAPVVTIMGHVDHGKTSLLDAIRETKVVAGEAGGITQHVSAYQVKTNAGADLTFVDTPGHAAFSEMRVRGANATDIVVLVVAADDGVMEQTKESIATARMAGVPIVVAVNKVDKEGADVQKVQNELMTYDLLPEEFGGDTQVAMVSAKQKTGLDELLEKILLQSEVLELKSNPNRSAEGVVVEAQMQRGLGTVGTVLIQRGTLRVGDIFVAGGAWGRVKVLIDHQGRRIKEAGPSTPVQVGGFDGVPAAGEVFTVVGREDIARDLAEARRKIARESEAAVLQGGLKSGMMSILNGEVDAGKELFELPVMIKADVQGSEQALSTALSEMISEDEYFMAKCNILPSGVGEITKSDVAIAGVSNAFVVGFNVGADQEATREARATGIDIGYYSVVYNVMDDIQAKLDELVSPTPDGEYTGRAVVKVIFNIGKVGNIAGSSVEDGVINKGGNVLVKRLGRIVHEGKLKTLKNLKADADRMVMGTECGIQVEGFEDFEEGDLIECYKMD
eukprot:g1815.t1